MQSRSRKEPHHLSCTALLTRMAGEKIPYKGSAVFGRDTDWKSMILNCRYSCRQYRIKSHQRDVVAHRNAVAQLTKATGWHQTANAVVPGSNPASFTVSWTGPGNTTVYLKTSRRVGGVPAWAKKKNSGGATFFWQVLWEVVLLLVLYTSILYIYVRLRSADLLLKNRSGSPHFCPTTDMNWKHKKRRENMWHAWKLLQKKQCGEYEEWFPDIWSSDQSKHCDQWSKKSK
jgi:hypothetical protein